MKVGKLPKWVSPDTMHSHCAAKDGMCVSCGNVSLFMKIIKGLKFYVPLLFKLISNILLLLMFHVFNVPFLLSLMSDFL